MFAGSFLLSVLTKDPSTDFIALWWFGQHHAHTVYSCCYLSFHGLSANYGSFVFQQKLLFCLILSRYLLISVKTPFHRIAMSHAGLWWSEDKHWCGI